MRLGVIAAPVNTDPVSLSPAPVTGSPSACVVGATDPSTGETIANCPAPCVVGATTNAGDTIAYCPDSSLIPGPDTTCPSGYIYDSVSFTCIPNPGTVVTTTWIPGISNNMVLGIGAGLIGLMLLGRRH